MTLNTNYRKQAIIFLELLLIYRPEMLTQYAGIDTVINLARVVLVGYVACLYLSKKAPSKHLICTGFIWGGYNVWCILNENWAFNIFIELALIICITMLIELWCSNNELHYVNLALRQLLFWYGILNTITILMGNKNEELFLGFDNDISMKMIPMIGIMIYTSVLTNGKIQWVDYMISGIFLLDFLLTKAATSLVSLLLMYILILVSKLQAGVFKSSTIIVGAMGLWISFHFFKIQSILSNLLKGTLGKDITLSYRIYIWESVVAAIKQRPLCGYGNIFESSAYYDIVYPMYYASITPHNFWLYICASAGLVGVVTIVIYIICCFRKVDLYSGKKENSILIACFLGYMLCGVFSSYYGMEYLVILTSMAYYSKKYVKIGGK